MNTDQGSTTTYFVGNYYELTGSIVTKYYYAGSQRIAMRVDGTLSFLLTDHLGSTSITTDTNGTITSDQMYSAWGEVRFSSGDVPTNYTYTGQYSYTADFGLMFYNARWYDSSLGRFAQADTVMPEQSQGVQAWDRYAYANNDPVKYSDPSGHMAWIGEGGDYNWQDRVHDAAISSWQKMRGWEADGFLGLIAGGMRHEPHMNIVGQGLQSLENDPDVIKKQGQIFGDISKNPLYGKQAFPSTDLSKTIEAGDHGSMIQDVLSGDQNFWMVKNANLFATNTKVSAAGAITITWQIRDSFDFEPDWSSKTRTGFNYWQYNILAEIAGHGIYDTLLQASAVPVIATWTTTTYPSDFICK